MNKSKGTIITFYSYKGGTGRSMALANVAWLLAENGKKVLVIDWDLEAPGLHRYLHPFLIDPELSDTPGLIDFFWGYANQAMTPPERNSAETHLGEEVADVTRYVVQLDWSFHNDGLLDFIPAGRQDPEYAERVNSFDWNNFYIRLDGEILLEKVRSLIRNQYDYILIDSRTGVSDTSGICTVAMPDRLVALFTLNNQSIEGVAAVLDSIAAQPAHASMQFFPIICRVELSEKDRLEAARRRTRRLFHRFLNKDRPSTSRDYWSDAEILYQPYYAYEEVLATFGDPTGSEYSENSLLAAMEGLTQKITGLEDLEMPTIPEKKRQTIRHRFTGADSAPPAGQTHSIETQESPEDRTSRARQYSEKMLKDAAYDATRARIKSLVSLLLIIGAGIAISAIQVFFWDYESLPNSIPRIICVFLGLVIAVGKGLISRMTRENILTSLEDWNVKTVNQVDIKKPGRLRIARYVPILAAVTVCLLQVWVAHISPGRSTTDMLTVVLGFLILFLDAYALWQDPDEIYVRSQWIADSISKAQRFYINLAGPYADYPEGPPAYRRFVESVEKIIDISSGRSWTK